MNTSHLAMHCISEARKEIRMTVLSEQPFIILKCEGDAEWMVGDHLDDAIGQSLLDFTGSRTDLVNLQASIQGESASTTETAQLMFYDWHGRDRSILVSLSHDGNNIGLQTCPLRMIESSTAIRRKPVKRASCCISSDMQAFRESKSMQGSQPLH